MTKLTKLTCGTFYIFRSKIIWFITIDDECSSAAASLGNHISGHTCVVSSVRKTCLLDNEVMVDCYKEVRVLYRINKLLILQPLYLWNYEKKSYNLLNTKCIQNMSIEDMCHLPLTVLLLKIKQLVQTYAFLKVWSNPHECFRKSCRQRKSMMMTDEGRR